MAANTVHVTIKGDDAEKEIPANGATEEVLIITASTMSSAHSSDRDRPVTYLATGAMSPAADQR